EVAELERRAQALLRRRRSAWAGPLRGLIEIYEYRRGFIEQATLTLNRLLQHGDELFRLAPLRQLTVTRAGTHMEDLAGCPHLARLATLRIRDSRPRPDGVLALARSPHLAGLIALQIRDA